MKDLTNFDIKAFLDYVWGTFVSENMLDGIVKELKRIEFEEKLKKI